ncbi:UNVERIFIED_ORG: pimeloyl-ACP methyl ester carboxylesterase [Rhizobium esperanzae]|uniref:Alpha/beta hydrolase n=1 Tax=Rhizobium phaseoli TaxID=396 RepID=A0A192T4Q4_9HYPH|nr:MULTISPECIES: alpha/beta hydrolase [Rhizobium]MDH6647130.1 pimeloyl-ACP methyl ester carboxylesterase [Rhizobium esperanzae]ANL38605.1 alpha/beta hydrolase family protein [Rhizobium phaseoli]ANL51354.1 alpha/beta hydrolase family protein [Rhizobium phaseoli]ANL57594.1 alpha/beta hydrolase family protein [Rhizobium phaseoli]ANL82986.1 alpha/beta hydrolase family protein [Rhizobium phaseoli]
MRAIAIGMLTFFSLFLAVAGARSAERWAELPAFPAMPAPKTSGMADVNDIKMYYAEYGEGDPILFIHGGLGNTGVWGHQIAEFARDHLVIVADSRGHGRSTRSQQPFGYDLMTSDYVALLDYLKIDKVTLVGWSDGGIIGIDMAMKHPEKLTRVIAQAANVTTDGVKPDVMSNRTFNAYIKVAGEQYRTLSPTPNEYDVFFTQISRMWATQPNWTATELGKITLPVTLAIGDHDEAVKLDHTEMMAKEIPGAKLVILKDASHFAMLQDPAGYNAMIRNAMTGR